mmetsp:Transcript_12312/g.14495  ORF Transcript_12312/g.14495 Transcript_12312/m.14495 type:complete len:323 (-) Transcript_12312:101-1069(-)
MNKVYLVLSLSSVFVAAAFIPPQHQQRAHQSFIPAPHSLSNAKRSLPYPSRSATRSISSTIIEAVATTRSTGDEQANDRIIAGALNELEVIYSQAASSIKCPFFRRRAADFIDNVAMIARFLVIRHKSLFNGVPLELEIPGCKAIGRHVLTNADGTVCKNKNLPSDQIYQVVKKDWSEENGKGYYITGRLNSTIYRDDCLFDGPDPDMPVRGLRKYLAAASQLFDAKESYAQLLELNTVDEGGEYSCGLIEARWKMEGILMLPWRPRVKPWTGWTKYHIDEDGMIALHEEGWDISVLEAFVGTIFPRIWKILWGVEDEYESL